MKHATPLAFSHPRAKRVCFDKDNGKTSSFKPDAVPENHFHLGSHNYAVVSDFADVARIHLRRYKLDATGSLLPTKDGITVTPSVWLALVREFSAIDQAFEDGKVFVIKDCLLLSRTVIENVTHIIIQRYFQRKDFTRKFLTPVSMLKETEWNVLKDIHKQITSKTVSIMFGRVFLKLLRQEVAKHIPFPKSDCIDCIDAEMVLTTSMVELLCNHIEENISSLFVCFGCLEGYENQLGHECMTYSNGQRISEYGDLAILNMDWDKLVADFVNRNIQMLEIFSVCTSCLNFYNGYRKIFEETDFPINDKVLASADFGDLSSELDEPFDGVLRGTFSCDKCDSVFTHRRSLERHRISIHTTSALFYCKICKKRFNRKDNFVRHSKIHKLTPIIMKLSRTANGEENSSANTSSEAAPGPSTATETTLSDHGRTSISTAPSRKRTVSPTRNACLDTFEVYTFFPDTSTSKDLTVITSCNEFENRGSGWEFQDVLKNELKIAIYKPLAAASYIPLPPKLIKKGDIKHQK
ncbi:PC4 domain-containing protein [Trichonephila clavipes]|nr:PC4 domain-containing protein [Trichonephila clavipes]